MIDIPKTGIDIHKTEIEDIQKMANCLVSFALYRFETPSYMRLCGALLFAYCPVIIITNTLLMSSLIATRQSLKNTSNLLIFCLSLSDTLFGAIFLPLEGIEKTWYDNPTVCAVQTAGPILQVFFYGNSMGITILLACDRYLHMNPDFHRSESRLSKLFKRPWIFVLLITHLLLSTALSIEVHFSLISSRQRLIISTLFWAMITLIALALIVALYTRGYLRIRRYVAENPIYGNRGESNGESPEYLNKLFVTVFLLLLALTVSILPVIIVSLMISFSYFTGSDSASHVTVLFYLITPFLMHTNAATNAMIIFYRNERSWQWLKSKVSRCCCCKQRIRHEEPDLPVVVCHLRTTGV